MTNFFLKKHTEMAKGKDIFCLALNFVNIANKPAIITRVAGCGEPVSPAPKRWSEEEQESVASLGYRAGPNLSKQSK